MYTVCMNISLTAVCCAIVLHARRQAGLDGGMHEEGQDEKDASDDGRYPFCDTRASSADFRHRLIILRIHFYLRNSFYTAVTAILR